MKKSISQFFKTSALAVSLLIVNSSLATDFEGRCASQVARQALIESFADSVNATPDINIESAVLFDTTYRVLKSQYVITYEGVIGYDEYKVLLEEVVTAGGYPEGLEIQTQLIYNVNPETCRGDRVMLPEND